MSILNCLEFYFSNANYVKDTFLRTTCEDSNGIKIETILTFIKLKKLNATEEDVKKVVKKAKNVEMKDGKLVKVKNDSYSKYITRNLDDYMIVIDGFDANLTLEEIETHLSCYLNPLLIRMKRDKKKQFTGAVLVELDSIEEVKKALSMKISAPLRSEQKENDSHQEGEKTEAKSSNVSKNKEQRAPVLPLPDKKRQKIEYSKDFKEKDNDSSKSKSEKPEDLLPLRSFENKTVSTEIDTLNKKTENSPQKTKKEDQDVSKKPELKLLTIQTKKEYQSKSQHLNHQKNKTENFIQLNKFKVFRFETKEKYLIKDIKKKVENVAFVDINHNILRFKQPQKQSVLSAEDIKLTLLTDDEYKQYVENEVFGKKTKK